MNFLRKIKTRKLRKSLIKNYPEFTRNQIDKLIEIIISVREHKKHNHYHIPHAS